MTPDIEARRRALQVVYDRYLRADRAWRLAQKEALAWFPASRRPAVPPIGDPGSHVRRLFDYRNRSLALLTIAHHEVTLARRRSARRIQVLALPSH